MKNIIIKIIKRCKMEILIKLLFPLYHLLYELLHKDYIILTASVNPVSHNWGDDVSKMLCKQINPDIKFIVNRYTWNIFKKDDYLCIGSIITWMTTPKSIIWGSGIVYPDQEITAKPKTVLAVRGPLTRDYLLKRGIECPDIYGDPALLFPLYYKPQVKKKYRLGIIPHFRDKNNPLLNGFKNDDSVLIIDVQNICPWHQFIDDICSCEYIASSSLHGVIISDAYNVPNKWVEFDGGERKRFAFQDYLASVGKKNENPYSFISRTSKEDLIMACKSWKPINIDIEKLLAVCPFKNHQVYE